MAAAVAARRCSWWCCRRSRALVLFAADAPGWLSSTAVGSARADRLYALLVPPLLYRIHRWEITHEAVYTLSGWLVREWRIAPISRVQTVDTERGPLQQLLKLADLTVTTASARGPVKISGLDEQMATELARTLTETTQATPGDAT